MRTRPFVRVTGRILNERWGVNALHALYREDGSWYHQLRKFPGVLFDRNGYLLFEKANTYRTSSYLQFGNDVHVPGGIAAVPGYVRVYEAPVPPDNELPAGPVRQKVEVNRIVRDTPLSRKIKALHAYRCQLCGGTVQLAGERLYAEAHHLQPLGAPDDGPDIAENIVCVCPNCHVLLDYGGVKLDAGSLSLVDGHAIGEGYIKYHNQHRFAG